MTQQNQANAIIRSHVLWATGGGLIPIPLVDFAAVTAIQ
ncbi:MAG: GTPase, partial [Cyanobacteria bacterium P01_H01_bin.162]